MFLESGPYVSTNFTIREVSHSKMLAPLSMFQPLPPLVPSKLVSLSSPTHLVECILEPRMFSMSTRWFCFFSVLLYCFDQINAGKSGSYSSFTHSTSGLCHLRETTAFLRSERQAINNRLLPTLRQLILLEKILCCFDDKSISNPI